MNLKESIFAIIFLIWALVFIIGVIYCTGPQFISNEEMNRQVEQEIFGDCPIIIAGEKHTFKKTSYLECMAIIEWSEKINKKIHCDL